MYSYLFTLAIGEVCIMATMNKELNRIEVKNVAAELKSQIGIINQFSTQLGNRNLVGPKKAEVVKIRREALKNIVYLVAAGIVNEVLDADIYGVLRAQVSGKHFKDPVGINDMLKGLLEEACKVPSEGARDLSLVELARLVETPYKYEPKPEDKAKQANPDASVNLSAESASDVVTSSEVPEVDDIHIVDIVDVNGNHIVIDKDNKTLYAATSEGEHPSTTGGEVVRKTFFGKMKSAAVWVKDTLCSIYSIIWSAIKKFCAYILTALVVGGLYVWIGSRWVFEKVKSPFVKEDEKDENIPAAV